MEPFINKKSRGPNQLVGSYLSLFKSGVVAIVILFYGCHSGYLKEEPPKSEICGEWTIDWTFANCEMTLKKRGNLG